MLMDDAHAEDEYRDVPARYSLPTTPESWIRYYDAKCWALRMDLASLRCINPTPADMKGIALLEVEVAKMQEEASLWRAELARVQESA